MNPVINIYPFKDVKYIQSSSLKDNRGYFYPSVFNELNCKFIQENISESYENVIRGLHYQTGEFAQSKLIRCFSGIIVDVMVDIRKDSPTYLKWGSVLLSHPSQSVFIPKGFAHGFSCISRLITVSYLIDTPYSKEHEAGIFAFDPDLNIEWEVCRENAVMSDKDKRLPFITEMV